MAEESCHNTLMQTLLIDCNYPIEDSLSVRFDSPVSCFDFDIVMWDVQGTFDNYARASGAYQGIPSLSDSSSVALLKAIPRRSEEFSYLLSLGRAVVIFPATESTVYVANGQTRVSGTGKNARSTRMVHPCDLYDAVPFPLETMEGNGISVRPLGALFAPLWRKTQEHWVYRSILKKYPGEKVAQISGTNKVVGSLYRSKDGGVFAALPEPYWQAEIEEDEGGSEVEGRDSDPHDSVPELLQAWICELLSGESEPAPDWVSSYTSSEEDDLIKSASQLQEELDELLVKVDAVKAAQVAEERWKELLYASGSVLENAVERALVALGFSMLDRIEGRADLRAEADGKRVIIEVKGLGKSAAEKNAAQLEKWVAEEAVAETGEWKPLLIVNGWRGGDVEKRTQPVFPNQMLPYCEARGHCLMTTSQLLVMARTALRDPSKCDAIRTEMLSTVGEISGWGIAGLLRKSSDAS